MQLTIGRASAAPALFAFALVFAAAPRVGAQQATPNPADANHPVKSPGNAEWGADAADAKARATAQKKLIYFEFNRPGCGDCRRMESLLYPAFDFEALLIGMVPVRLDLDAPDAKALAERYGITDVPAVLITTPEGRLVFLVQGFKNAPDFYSHARGDLQRYRQFAQRIEGQDVATLSAEEAYATGRELFSRRDLDAARPRLKRATVAPNPRAGIRESALEGLAAAELQLGRPAEARKTIDRLITTTASPEQKERAELFRAQIPLAQNKPEEALALYKKFAADHPSSKYMDKVHEFIARLEPAPAPPK